MSHFSLRTADPGDRHRVSGRSAVRLPPPCAVPPDPRKGTGATDHSFTPAPEACATD